MVRLLLLFLAPFTLVRTQQLQCDGQPKYSYLRFADDCASWECEPGYKRTTTGNGAYFCCPVNALAGHYSVCDASGYVFKPCPVVPNVVFIGNSGPNDCERPYCSGGSSLVMSAETSARAKEACNVFSNGTLNPRCESVLKTLCFSPCPAKQTLLQQLKSEKYPNGGPTLTDDGNYQCIDCVKCPVGSYEQYKCEGSRPTVCSSNIPPTNGTFAMVHYTWPLALIQQWTNTSYIFPVTIEYPNGTIIFRPEIDLQLQRFVKPLTLTEYLPCPVAGVSINVMCNNLECTPHVTDVCKCAAGRTNYPKCDATCPAAPTNAVFRRDCDWTCSPNYFLQTASKTCAACAQPTCAANQYKTPCATDANSECKTCTTTCPADHYMASPCTATADAVCKPCTQCLAGGRTRSPCSATKDTVCVGCVACRANQYEIAMCTADTPTQCKDCKECPAGTIESTPCTIRNDRVCTKCPGRAPVNGQFGKNCKIECDEGFEVFGSYCMAQEFNYTFNSDTITKLELAQVMEKDPACYAEAWKSSLAQYHASPTFIAEIEVDGVKISCYPVPCKCNSTNRRRLLQQTTDDRVVTLTYSYQGARQKVWDIQRALPNVVDVVVVDSQQTDCEASISMMFVVLIAVGAALLSGAAVWFSCVVDPMRPESPYERVPKQAP